MATIVKDMLETALRKTFPNVQSGISSVVYSFVEQLMMDLLCKKVIEKR